MAGPQHLALAQRRVRQAVHRRLSRTSSIPIKRTALFIKMNDHRRVARIRVDHSRCAATRACRRSAEDAQRLQTSVAGTTTLWDARPTGTADELDVSPATGDPFHGECRGSPMSGNDETDRTSIGQLLHCARLLIMIPEPARHQPRAVHDPGAGAGRSFRGTRHQPRTCRPEVRAALRAKFGLDDPVWRSATCPLDFGHGCRATGASPSSAESMSTS